MSAKENTNVVLVGVGGQGILLASAIVATAALDSGYDVKTNEIHGMAQRGGSVLAQVRYGEKVYSPLVPKGTATVLASLEKTEAIRYVDYLAPDGLAVISDQVIVPVTVSSGAATYPELDEEGLRKIVEEVIANNPKAVEDVKNGKTYLNIMKDNLDVLTQALK